MEIPITTYVDRVSTDGRRRYRDEVLIEPPSPVKRQRAGISQHDSPVPLPNVDLDGLERYQMGFDVDDQPPEIPNSTAIRAAKPKISKPSAKPIPLHSEFIVLHTNGIHDVTVDACNCEHCIQAGALEEQLLRAGWFPATDDKPRTCVTIEVLDSFVTQTYQAKTTMYDFYTALEKLMNHTGVKPPNCYHAFLHMGVMGTKQGELALRCPCCPIPDVNLPVGWEHAPPECQFLYIMFLAFNACFRLKRRLVSNELKDPSLGSGWAFLLESVPYRKFLLMVTDQKEMSTCSELAALDFTNMKFARGYSATGVGMGVCARHEFVQPNGVGDLQKGEQYANMDYIFVMILRHIDPRLRKIISYDIVCQWWKNLWECLINMPPGARLVLIMRLFHFVIPKMHIKGHLGDCQRSSDRGHTSGETSTREMGPGSREDTLNAHWGSWNWDKLIGLGERLQTKLDRANKEYADQLQSFTEFSTQQAERLNPYRMKRAALTEAAVLLQFEQEEAERTRNGVPSIHSVSPSSFIAAALEVEDEQQRVRVQVERKRGGTTAQEIDVLVLRRGLNRSILRLRLLQTTYTPVAIVALGQRQNVPEGEQPENVPLFLPLALTPTQRQLDGVKELATIEDSVRDAQCSSALERLQHQLHVKSRLLTYKKWQSRHQGANTRSRGIVERNETKIRLHSEKYQMAWAAKVQLAGGDARGVGWQMLRKEDIRCMEDAEELARTSQKQTEQAQRRADHEADLRRMGELPPLTSVEEEERAVRGGESVQLVSWIWTAAGTSGSDEDLEEALCMEWCKAYARIRRWVEEVQLVKEVRCISVTLEYRAVEWENRARAVPVSEEQRMEWEGAVEGGGRWSFEHAEGVVAYALKQAGMYCDIAGRVTVSMREERRGRGKKRRMVYDDEWEWVETTEGERAEEHDELEDLLGDEVADDDFILGGGTDDD
ncbi:hypothetical protein B0H14DRAFT_3445824 [Mycena olivaceomarginata]|nr:hypothetical protein B0H14DRAFT_3445824 [Mycena olivaceomarginata]